MVFGIWCLILFSTCSLRDLVFSEFGFWASGLWLSVSRWGLLVFGVGIRRIFFEVGHFGNFLLKWFWVWGLFDFSFCLFGLGMVFCYLVWIFWAVIWFWLLSACAGFWDFVHFWEFGVCLFWFGTSGRFRVWIGISQISWNLDFWEVLVLGFDFGEFVFLILVLSTWGRFLCLLFRVFGVWWFCGFALGF